MLKWKKRKTEIRNRERFETVWTVLTGDQVIESDPVALSSKRVECPLQVKAEFSRSPLTRVLFLSEGSGWFSYHLCSSPTLPSEISSCAKAGMGCY